MNASSDRNKSIVIRFINALTSEDKAVFDELLDDDFSWVIPQSPEFSSIGGKHSKAEWMKLYDDHHGDFPNGKKFEIKGIIAEGDKVAVEVESKGDSRYGYFHNLYHFLFEVKNNKIILVKEYADSLYMNEFAKRMKAEGNRE